MSLKYGLQELLLYPEVESHTLPEMSHSCVTGPLQQFLKNKNTINWKMRKCTGQHRKGQTGDRNKEVKVRQQFAEWQ